jgi:tRNA1(Val) A37 N6-methylase TrmN6
VHSVAGEPARRVLVQAAREYKGGASWLTPLVIHGEDRRSYTDEAARILGG